MKAQFGEFLGHLRSYGFGSRWLIVIGFMIQMALVNVGIRLGIEYAIALWVLLLIVFLTWIVIALRGSWQRLGKAVAVSSDRPHSSSDGR